MQKLSVLPRLEQVPWSQAAYTGWYLTQRENLPTSPSNGSEADALMMPEAVPMGQMPHAMRFGNNQVITQRALWMSRCPNGAHSPAA